MLYPEKLKDNEYIRMIALKRNKDGEVGKSEKDRVVRCVKSFSAFQWFINEFRETHDVYNQIATNYGKMCIRDSLETRNLMRSNLDMGFMPLVMILLLALITSLGLKEMEIFKLILMIQIQE